MGSRSFSRSSIQAFLSHADGTDINKSYEMLKRIWESSTDGKKAIQTIFELSEIIESDESMPVDEYIDKDTTDILLAKYSNYVNSYLRLLVDSRPSVNEFYTKLWEFINSDTFLQTEESKALAFSLIWNDFRLPYYAFDNSGKMDDEEFLEIRKRITIEISKARLVIFTNHDLKTEKAASLLSIINELNDEKDKQVLLAAILSLHERRIRREDHD